MLFVHSAFRPLGRLVGKTGILVVLAVSLLDPSQAGAGTVAYWRFETGPAGALVAHAGADGAFDGTTADESGNGNHLSAWTVGRYAGFAYRADVPFANLPQNGQGNQFSIKNTGANPAMFTSPIGSSGPGVDARAITPAQFSVEVFYKAEANAGYRTVVGRDAQNVATANGNLAALYLQVRPDDSVGIAFTDVAGFAHSAYSPPGWIYGFNFDADPEGTTAPWYHLAGVSDGTTLKMFVDGQLVASTDLTASGSPNRALAKGAVNGADWTAGAWSVGRGLYAGNHTDRAYGFIDEVRISNHALSPGEFLFTLRPHLAGTRVSGGNLKIVVADGRNGASCELLGSSDATLPISGWALIESRLFGSRGSLVFNLPIDPAVPRRYFRVRSSIPAPPPGALTYELAGGSENWPANIRAQIVYAMDGAVALYNRYGTFSKHLYANYNPGVPTAQAGYSGWIDFGGQIGYRTAIHEIAHTLGVGTVGNWSGFIQGNVWTGANAVQQIRAFDGPDANVFSDGTHFWPYGLNYDNEGSTENNRRHVLMVAAFRKDLGI